jgi:hypothetical protein
MFWALAWVSFRAAKIVSCNKKKKIHGLRSKLPQLFYFTSLQFSQSLLRSLCSNQSLKVFGSSICGRSSLNNIRIGMTKINAMYNKMKLKCCFIKCVAGMTPAGQLPGPLDLADKSQQLPMTFGFFWIIMARND